MLGLAVNKNEFKKVLQGVYGYMLNHTIEHYSIVEHQAGKMICCDFGDQVVGLYHRDHPFEIIDNRLVIKFSNVKCKVSYRLGKEVPFQAMIRMGQYKSKEKWERECEQEKS